VAPAMMIGRQTSLQEGVVVGLHQLRQPGTSAVAGCGSGKPELFRVARRFLPGLHEHANRPPVHSQAKRPKKDSRVSGDRLPSLGSNQDSPDPEGPFMRVRVTRCWSLLALGVGLCRSLLAHMSGLVAVWQPELGPLMVGDLA
jgi:hypothetical protein